MRALVAPRRPHDHGADRRPRVPAAQRRDDRALPAGRRQLHRQRPVPPAVRVALAGDQELPHGALLLPVPRRRLARAERECQEPAAPRVRRQHRRAPRGHRRPRVEGPRGDAAHARNLHRADAPVDAQAAAGAPAGVARVADHLAPPLAQRSHRRRRLRSGEPGGHHRRGARAAEAAPLRRPPRHRLPQRVREQRGDARDALRASRRLRRLLDAGRAAAARADGRVVRRSQGRGVLREEREAHQPPPALHQRRPPRRGGPRRRRRRRRERGAERVPPAAQLPGAHRQRHLSAQVRRQRHAAHARAHPHQA
mmetsp:Transcript_8241/g.25718  ORF Transcript_8241/g.25718 Transcript_8241/m.25718 type:complete len:310 (+) Transcript_8241:686-1615(+)